MTPELEAEREEIRARLEDAGIPVTSIELMVRCGCGQLVLPASRCDGTVCCLSCRADMWIPEENR